MSIDVIVNMYNFIYEVQIPTRKGEKFTEKTSCL